MANEITITIPFGMIRKVRKPAEQFNQTRTYFEIVTMTGGDLPCATSAYSYENLQQIADRQIPMSMTIQATFTNYNGKLGCTVDAMSVAEYGAVPASVSAPTEQKRKAS